MTVAEAIQARTDEMSRELRAGSVAEGVVLAYAMMAAATGHLTRLMGHDAVEAQLRADADMVASYKPAPGEPAAPTAALQ